MPEVVKPQAARLKLVALVHHPLAAETGLPRATAEALRISERLALQAVRGVVVTSQATKQALRAYEVAAERIVVVEPGTDAARLARGRIAGPLALLCVATLTPRKGHDLLIDALATLTQYEWHLTCVGSAMRSPATVEQLKRQIRRTELAARVTLIGEVDASALPAFYLDADVFVLPTRFEGYGMAVAEALAHGLPIISTMTGAIPKIVPPDAGLLVPPDDEEALRNSLERIFADPQLLATLAQGARNARESLTRWPDACARMSDILQRVSRDEQFQR
jgi:glycosyltransferase involved in cell wall biosynthesis